MREHLADIERAQPNTIVYVRAYYIKYQPFSRYARARAFTR